jgi:hypothetical protein
MSGKLIQDDLPSLYKKFFPSFFQLHVPEENFATCFNCSMAYNEENKKDNQGRLTFAVDRKCCTFYPNIPNYLIGGILSDKDPLMDEGKKRIRERIKNGRGVSPLGIFAPKLYTLKYTNRTNSSFGNSGNLLCPYFEKSTGGCTVWKYREGVCSTWFCKTSTGQAGKDFYNTLNSYLNFIQGALIKYVAHQINVPYLRHLVQAQDTSNLDYTKNISAEELDGLPVSENERKSTWGLWYEKEEDFFIKCYQLTTNLSTEQFKTITGIEQQILLKDLEISRTRMIRLPDKLKKSQEIFFEKTAEGNYLITLKTNVEVFAPQLELPAFVLDSFDGIKTTNEVNKQLNKVAGIELDNEILLTLFQHGILVETKY